MKNRKLLAGPYLFWSVSFIIIPLLMIFYYGLTDKEGTFTWSNIAMMASPENLKALGLALLLSLVSTLICLVLAYPLAMILSEKKHEPDKSYRTDFYSSYVDELSSAYTRLADTA